MMKKRVDFRNMYLVTIEISYVQTGTAGLELKYVVDGQIGSLYLYLCCIFR